MEFSTNVTCPKCKSIGVADWEKIGAERSLIRLSRNFYERLSRKVPYPIEVVCLECGTVQDGQVQPSVKL
jgi:hypothetical protein